MIAKDVSKILPQLLEDALSCNLVTQSSKTLSGVAIIVRAISCVVSVELEQSPTFSSKHSKALSIFIELELWLFDEVSLAAAEIIENENSINNKARNVHVFFMGV